MEQSDSIVATKIPSSELYTLMYQAEFDGAFVAHIRGKMCRSLDDFFCEISSSMRFPWYFGWNWAAFDECMTDLEWLRFSRLLIVIDDYDLIFQEERTRQTCINLLHKHLSAAAAYWSEQNIPIEIYLNQKPETV